MKEIVGISIGAILLCLLLADALTGLGTKYSEEEEDA